MSGTTVQCFFVFVYHNLSSAIQMSAGRPPSVHRLTLSIHAVLRQPSKHFPSISPSVKAITSPSLLEQRYHLHIDAQEEICHPLLSIVTSIGISLEYNFWITSCFNTVHNITPSGMCHLFKINGITSCLHTGGS